MRLQQKILLIILPLIIAPLLVLAIVAYNLVGNANTNLENTKLRADVNLRAQILESYKDKLISAITYLSFNSEFKKAFKEDESLTQQRKIVDDSVRQFYQIFPHTHSIQLIDKTGVLIHQLALHDHNVGEGAAMPLSNQVQWQLIASTEHHKNLLEIQAPVKERGILLGYIRMFVEPNWQQELQLNQQQGDKFMIADADGMILYAFPQAESGSMVPPKLYQELLQSTRSGQFSKVRFGNGHLFFSGKEVEQRYLFLFGQDKNYLYQGQSSITLIVLIIFVLASLLTMVLMHRGIKKLVVAPIDKLANAKKKVAQGNLEIKLDLDTKDEFGELFAAFNVMVRQLVVYREKERDSRLRLEYKVKERTEELEATNFALASSNKALESARQHSDQANELKSAFVANMSHEIRTPLTAILGFTEQVIADTPRSAKQLDLLGRVLKSGKHLLSLINNILDLSKIEADKLEIEVLQVDVFELFNDVVSLLSTQAAEKNLEFEFNYHYPIPKYIRTDSTRLKQILLNLASNAIKFTESGYVHIDVRYNQPVSQLEVVVSDSGIGMEQEVQDSIFQPFTQADVSVSRKFGGTGLGLVISKSLANLLGGDISVTSELNKGSKFTFDFDTSADGNQYPMRLITSMLDLAQDQGETIKFDADKPVEMPAVATVSGKVLIAEDVEDNQYLLKLLLDSMKVDHVIVDNGEKAVEAALEQEFDLILMDMQMPVMGGLEAASLLRQAGIETPIYALTANVMKEDMLRHEEAGCNGTIAKPIEKSKFIKVVQSVLNKKDEQPQYSIPQNQLEQLKLDYLKQLAQQNKLITKLTTEQEAGRLQAEFHKIKGSAGSYGFMELSQQASELEKECSSQLKNGHFDWPMLDSKIDDLQKNINSVLQVHRT